MLTIKFDLKFFCRCSIFCALPRKGLIVYVLVFKSDLLYSHGAEACECDVVEEQPQFEEVPLMDIFKGGRPIEGLQG